jgi:hypothetical protein
VICVGSFCLFRQMTSYFRSIGGSIYGAYKTFLFATSVQYLAENLIQDGEHYHLYDHNHMVNMMITVLLPRLGNKDLVQSL